MWPFAGGMITLTGLVLTAVTLIVQTLQGQSPRLLRVLNRTDRTPVLFGTFMATFTFALLVLSQVHADSVPSVSVSVSVLLVLVSTSLFLRLLVTFRTTLTTGGLVRSVGGDEIMLYGAGSLQVARRLHALLSDLLAAAPPDRQGIGSSRREE